jgi:RNA polymerase sigma factor (sigma-70 family)
MSFMRGDTTVERVLLQNLKEGDHEAFAVLYNEYANYALRVAMAVTGNKANAADAVQEAFLRVYRNIQSFDLNQSFEPWFYRILINECNRILGKNTKVVYVEDFTESQLENSEEDDYKFEKYEDLYTAIQHLEENNKIPIILRYLKGFKESEIAEILGVNINTIKSRIFKGKQKLKGLLEKMEDKSSEEYGRHIDRQDSVLKGSTKKKSSRKAAVTEQDQRRKAKTERNEESESYGR